MLLLGDGSTSPTPTRWCASPTSAGQTQITAQGQKILDLPAGGYNNHWTRNVVANPDGSKLYVSVGSARRTSTSRAWTRRSRGGPRSWR